MNIQNQTMSAASATTTTMPAAVGSAGVTPKASESPARNRDGKLGVRRQNAQAKTD